MIALFVLILKFDFSSLSEECFHRIMFAFLLRLVGAAPVKLKYGLEND